MKRNPIVRFNTPTAYRAIDPVGGPVPVSPAQGGMLGQGKAGGAKEDVAHARIVVPESRRPDKLE
jgi:hypothetical protein